ncbi:MAG: hypothetical protein KGI73_01745 [Patescibacteria group bacterium]|nr:hypothetical protein [Patescibacteria group bacterium]
MADTARIRQFLISHARPLIAGGVVLIAGYALLTFVGGMRAATPEVFSIVEQGTVHWYQLSGTTLTAISGPLPAYTNPTMPRIVDRTSQLRSGDTPVLALVDGVEGQTFGVVRSDGTFIQLIADGTAKTALAANASGAVAYDVFAQSGQSIVFFDIFHPEQGSASLGSGFSPAVTRSGAVLAFSDKGLIRVDPITAFRETLLSRPGLTYGTAAISPDAAYTVMPNLITGNIDAFSLDSDQGLSTSYIGSVNDMPDAVSFVTPTEFVTHDTSGFALYIIGKMAVTKAADLTLKSS